MYMNVHYIYVLVKINSQMSKYYVKNAIIVVVASNFVIVKSYETNSGLTMWLCSELVTIDSFSPSLKQTKHIYNV